MLKIGDLVRVVKSDTGFVSGMFKNIGYVKRVTCVRDIDDVQLDGMYYYRNDSLRKVKNKYTTYEYKQNRSGLKAGDNVKVERSGLKYGYDHVCYVEGEYMIREITPRGVILNNNKRVPFYACTKF